MNPRGMAGSLAAAILIAGAVLSAPATAGDPSKGRQVEKPYYVSRIMGGGPLSALPCRDGSPRGCVEVVPRRGERFVHAAIADDAGGDVYGYVNQDVDGDGMSDFGGPFCKESGFPIRIQPQVPVRIFIMTHTDHCPGQIATKGTVSITLGSSVAAVREALKN